jgi:hypothetical protein
MSDHDKSSIGEGGARLQEIRTGLRELSLNSVRKVLPDRAIRSACLAAGLEWRERKIVPIVVVLHMVMAALWPEKSFAASWRVIWARMASRLPGAAGSSPGSGAVSKARARVPLKVWAQLFAWLSARLQEQAEAAGDRWRELRLVLVDGFTVSMPDQPGLFDAFGRGHGKHGLFKYPLARVVATALANSRAVLDYRLGGYRDSESALTRELLPGLKSGDLLIADRLFAGAHYYAAYLAQGVQFLTRVHQRLKLGRLPRLEIHGPGDFITSLRLNEVYRRKHPELPAAVTVRLIQVEARVRGKRQVFWLATSLLDAKLYPAREIAELYSRRWRIETLFLEIKGVLGADVLRSLTPDGVRKELAARMLACNVVRSIILEAANEHGRDPLRISFTAALRTILSFAPALGSEPPHRLPAIYRAMLEEIASQLVPIRPGRTEPRCIRRERLHYPYLKTSRAVWRRLQAAS